MSEDTPLGEPAVSIPAPAGSDSLSLEQAAKSLMDFRRKPDEAPAEIPEIPDAPPTAPEADTAVEAEASPPQEATSETPEASEPETPVIDPPRSWTKEAKERWSQLPRETQEYLAQRESDRDRGLAQSQQKAADERKALEAARTEAEKVRAQYEAQLPALMQALQDANAQHFGDIKSVEDVAKLAAEDPFRYIQWQAHQSKLAAVKAEQDAAERRQVQEKQTSWQQHVTEEAKKFNESLSENDKGKLKDWMAEAPKFLNERGFTDTELTDLWNGKDKISIHDHRLQSLILDGLKYRDVQNAKTKIVQKPLPPVVKPGSQAPASGNAAKIAALTKQLDNSTGVQAMRIAAQITQLRRKG